MPDREKVVKGLEHCFHGQECCGDTECPYYIEHLSDSCCLEDCQENLKADALAILKEQEEVIHCKDCYYYHKPEYGFTIGDCTYRTAWYPVKENEFCSLAKRKEGR